MFPCSQVAARGGGGKSRNVESGGVDWICGLVNICVNASITFALPPPPRQHNKSYDCRCYSQRISSSPCECRARAGGQRSEGSRTLLTVDYWLSAGSKLWRLSAFTRMHYWALTSFHAVNLRHLILLAPLPLPLAVAVADAVDFWYYDVLAEGLNELTAHRGHCRIALTTLTLPPAHPSLQHKVDCGTKQIWIWRLRLLVAVYEQARQWERKGESGACSTGYWNPLKAPSMEEG